MRFAWLRKQLEDNTSVTPGCIISLSRTVYNAAWLAPIILAYMGKIDYSTGFIAFTAISVVRLCANLYMNNALTLEQAERFPLRS